MYETNNAAFQWKISLKLDLSIRAQEIILSGTIKTSFFHPSLRFNNDIFSQVSYQKVLGTFVDDRLTFEIHLKLITAKVNKTVGLLQKLQNNLPRLVLMIIRYQYHGDTVYDKAYSEKFHQKSESI